jgi:hypothetical protein
MKRRVFLLLELDDDEQASVLPPHLQGLVSRPLIEPITTRKQSTAWFPTEEEKREQRRSKALAKRKGQ